MYSSFIVNDELWVVMEYLVGGSLTDIGQFLKFKKIKKPLQTSKSRVKLVLQFEFNDNEFSDTDWTKNERIPNCHCVQVCIASISLPS